MSFGINYHFLLSMFQWFKSWETQKPPLWKESNIWIFWHFQITFHLSFWNYGSYGNILSETWPVSVYFPETKREFTAVKSCFFFCILFFNCGVNTLLVSRRSMQLYIFLEREINELVDNCTIDFCSRFEKQSSESSMASQPTPPNVPRPGIRPY